MRGKNLALHLEHPDLKSLRARWGLVLALSLTLLLGGYHLLSVAWRLPMASRWAGLTALFLTYLLWRLWQGLEYNHRPDEARLLADFGLGNILTVMRGMMIAALGGFLFSPRPEGWLAWVPGALYTLAVLIDLFDGYAARRTGRITVMGRKLDMALDGVGVLAASGLAVWYGQAPLWFLSVGLARYLFLALGWARRRRGLEMHPLPESRLRRPLAGIQMGFIAVLLWPVISPPGTHLAAVLFAAPFLTSFTLDWLAVSGWRRPAPGRDTSPPLNETAPLKLLPQLGRYAWLLALPLLWWAVRDVSPWEVWRAVQNLSAFQVLALIFLNAGILGLLSYRWWLLLRTLGHELPFLELLKYRLAAFGVSYFTPGPQFGGEPLQVYAARWRHQVPISSAVASVSLDKLLELLVNFTFLAAGTGIVLEAAQLGHQSQFPILPGVGVPITAILVAALAYVLALKAGRRPLSMLSGFFVRLPQTARWHRVIQEATAAEEQVACIARRKTSVLAQALLLSALAWGAMMGEYWLALRFLGLRLDLVQTMSLLIVVRLAFLSPSPGGLGILEAGQVLAMSSLGLDPAMGIGISLLIRARDVVLGLAGLWLGAEIVRSRTKGWLAPQAGD
jgi:uncharacterized protein (TIRG00374 family)